MFYIELTSDQKESALTQCNVIRPKPALPPKPKMGAGNENKKPAPLENAELEIKTKSEPHHDLTITRNDESIQNENGLPANTYPCICEHLNIEVTVPTPSECRKYFLKRSLEDANLLMRYLDTGRDSGNSSVASSSSSSLIYVPSSNSRNTATASVTTPTQTTTASATNQQQQSSVVCSEIPMQNTPVEGSNVRKPLVGETRVNTLERNRIQAIEDEHKYETLDHGARPPQLSEDEGVCCTNIKSKITKKAKELVRPYQKGDHPRDRPPIPAKPPRPSLQKSSRPNSMCLEADMSSSTDPEPEIGKSSDVVPPKSSSVDEDAPVVSSDSEEEKELTPPPLDPREKALRHAANVAREMASSEAAFVDALKLIVEDFKGAINDGREERGEILIPNEDLDPILLYLPEILKFSSDLLENLNARVARYDEDKVIADVFVKIGQFLKLYAHYIKDYEARCNYLEEARKKYPEFNQIVKQFEASPRCNKLSVIQYMLKPVQRIPQYRLLLGDYFRHLPEDHPDRASAQQALNIVSAVADHADQTMKQGENHAEMVRLQNSLMTTRFNVFKPGRMLIKKGNLLKHDRKTPSQKHVVLFSDCLAYMTQVQSSLNTLKLNRELSLLGLTVKPDETFPNEFSVLSPDKSFTLIAQNQDEREEWIEAIRQAVNVFEQKRRTFQAKSKRVDESEDSEVNYAPVWTPDSRVSRCQICTAHFTTFHRRHHCRNCGIVVCGDCSRRKARMSYTGDTYVRVCDTCAVKIPRERLKSSAGLPEIMPETPKPKKGDILFELGSNDDGITMSGYLKMFKKGSWKQYWYLLKDRVLYVYKASKDVAPVDQLVVLGFEVVDTEDKKKNDQVDLCFTLRHQGLDDMVLCAEDANTAARWKETLRNATQMKFGI